MPQSKAKKPGKNGSSTRERILAAALELLQSGGRDAVTTRAVADAADVQPPVLYRHFGDKANMLDALAEHGFRMYLARKRRIKPSQDPVDLLRAGWDEHIEFGLSQPKLHMLMYSEPRVGAPSSAATHALELLRQRVAQVAAAGRLRLPEDQAVSLFFAAATGIVFVILNLPDHARDRTLSVIARESALQTIAITTSQIPSESPEKIAALTLLAGLDTESSFSDAERALLKEWLRRITRS